MRFSLHKHGLLCRLSRRQFDYIAVVCLVHFMTKLTVSVFANATTPPTKDKWDVAHNMPLFQQIPECNCSRPYFYPPKFNQTLKSTCSDEGTFYESRQKVVTFTLYYNSSRLDPNREKLYEEGIQLNLQRMRMYYPSYTMRLYTDTHLKDDYCNYICKNPDLFWCDINRVPILGNMSAMYFRTWRFLPLADQTVDLFLSRDLDSVIIEREMGAVRDWLRLGKPIHLMRDMKEYHNVPILPGLWGARNDLLGPELATRLLDLIIIMSKELPQYMTMDQEILNEVIYYPLMKDIAAYDSYHCQRWKNETLVRPFPIMREKQNDTSNFVGSPNFGRYVEYFPICPEECRPSYGKDWDFC